MAEKNSPINKVLAIVTGVSVLVAAYAIYKLEPPAPEPKSGPVTRDMTIYEGKVECDAAPDPHVRVVMDSVRFTNTMTVEATLKLDHKVEWNSVQTDTVVVQPNEGQEIIKVAEAVVSQIPFDVLVGPDLEKCSPEGDNRPKIIIDK